MELNRRQEIAVGVLTGSIIALFLIVVDLTKNISQKILVILILIELILISFKLIRYPSISLQFIGDILKKIGL